MSIFSIPKKFKINFNHGVKKSSLLLSLVPPDVITKYAFLFFNNPSLLPLGLNLNVSFTLAARVGETFRFKPNGRREGLLKNKRAYLVITSGGTKLNSDEDFLTPWLKFILNFFGIEKIDVISADQMALDYEKSIKDAEEQIENIFKN